jgi:hypothetical protein
MNSTIQTSIQTYYTVTKYKGSDIMLSSTTGTLYNLGEIMTSNYQSLSSWVRVCKENCKRFTKLPSKEKVSQQNISETLRKKQRRQTYMANDKLVYLNKINHPNYNPFSPLFEAEIKGKPRTATMDDAIAHQRFLKAMNGNYDADVNPPPQTVNNDIQANQSNIQTPMETMETTTQTLNQMAPANIGVASGTQHPMENEILLQPVSDTHAPKHLTWESTYKPRVTDSSNGNQDHTYALVVRIGQKKNQNLKFNEGRILTSLLTSLQKVSPHIKIKPYDKKRVGTGDIESPAQIMFNEGFYLLYIEEPIITKKNHFICRIHFSSNKPFFWFKKNVFFQRWLSQESIRLEENNLEEIHCPKVGFLTQCHPRASLIHVFEERIKQTFAGCDYPPFTCSIEHISVRQTTTKVIVIRSAEKDVAELLELFKKAKRIHFHSFIPWREWNAMISPKQLDLIQRQNKNMTSSKSIILSGFKNDENVKFDYSLAQPDDMILTTEKDIDDNTANAKKGIVTVAEFLYQHYKDCEGNELFTYIYPVALGVREILVQHCHAQEVIELCKVIKQDMFSYMNFDAAKDIFENIEVIQDNSINHTRWEPFQTPTNYKAAYESPLPNKNEASRKHYKRSSETDLKEHPMASYAQAAANKTKQPTHIPQNNRGQSTHHTTVPKQSSDEMLLFRQQLLELSSKQQEQDKNLKLFEEKQEKTQKLFEEKQERINTHMLTELKTTNDIINNNILIPIEKTSQDISDIRQQMMAMQDLTSHVRLIISQMNNNTPNKDTQIRNINEEMVIDKDANKRNFYGKLRNGEGYIYANENNKENIPAGGNHNNCNYETDIVGARSP